MTKHQDTDDYDIDRRTILKSAAAASAMGLVGIPAMSGNAVADDVPGDPASQFNLYGIDHFSTPNKLVEINSADLVPGAGPITVQSTDLDTNVDVNTVASHPVDGLFYSTDLQTNTAFTIDPSSGAVTSIGSSNPVLGGIAGSAILMDSSGNPRWYGITHAGASPASTLFEIDLTDGSTTEKGGLHTVVDNESVPVVARHLGMGVNFLTDNLWGVIGDPDNNTASSVFRVVDVETGQVELTDEDALTGGRSVGAALGPCANVMYVVRTGNAFYGYDVASNQEYSYGKLQYEEGSLDFDSLTVPYGFECVDCEDCIDDGQLAKYEYECVETELTEEEAEVCVDYDFVFEKGDGDLVSYAGDFESKDGEAFEPISATFGTEYCSVWAVVKSGQEFEVQGFGQAESENENRVFPISEGEFTVRTANDDKYAISFVAFFCTEDRATEFAENFASRGRGGGRPN